MTQYDQKTTVADPCRAKIRLRADVVWLINQKNPLVTVHILMRYDNRENFHVFPWYGKDKNVRHVHI